MKAQKPTNKQYPIELKTIGDHLRKRRLDLELTQKEAAGQISVSEASVHNWELGRTNPEFVHLPKLIKFIGYLPIDSTGLSLGAKIAIYRQAHGKSQEQFARELGIDPTTMGRWEKDKGHPFKDLIAKVEKYFW